MRSPRVYASRFTPDTLESTLADGLAWARWEDAIPQDSAVFVKPNLTYPRYKQGVTTSPAFLDALLGLLRSRTKRIWVGESDGGYRGWPAEMAFQFHDLPRICKRHDARLVNLSREPVEKVTLHAGNRVVSLELPRLLTRDTEALITIPVPKVHSVTRFSGAVKNQWGCIPSNMRIQFHPIFHQGIMQINQLVHTRLAVMDGTFMLDRHGPMTGSPVEMNTLIVSTDIRAADIAACNIMGIDSSRVRHLNGREETRSDKLEIVLNAVLKPEHSFVLQKTLRSRIVAFAFDHSWAVWLIWQSKLGDAFHKALYSLFGNPVRADISLLAEQLEQGSESMKTPTLT